MYAFWRIHWPIVVVLAILFGAIAALLIYFYSSNFFHYNQEKNMLLTSPAFRDNDFIPRAYSCDAGGQHPELEWTGVPTSTKSLALIVTDPDAPAGTWTHWTLWNINPETKDIGIGVVPVGVGQGKNSSGSLGWEPPCPPSGVHHYIFTLYAVDTVLSLPSGSSRTDVEAAMAGHVIGQASLTGLYQR